MSVERVRGKRNARKGGKSIRISTTSRRERKRERICQVRMDVNNSIRINRNRRGANRRMRLWSSGLIRPEATPSSSSSSSRVRSPFQVTLSIRLRYRNALPPLCTNYRLLRFLVASQSAGVSRSAAFQAAATSVGTVFVR